MLCFWHVLQASEETRSLLSDQEVRLTPPRQRYPERHEGVPRSKDHWLAFSFFSTKSVNCSRTSSNSDGLGLYPFSRRQCKRRRACRTVVTRTASAESCRPSAISAEDFFQSDQSIAWRKERWRTVNIRQHFSKPRLRSSMRAFWSGVGA